MSLGRLRAGRVARRPRRRALLGGPRRRVPLSVPAAGRVSAMRERIPGLVVPSRMRLAAERASFSTPWRAIGRTAPDWPRFPRLIRGGSRTACDHPRFPTVIPGGSRDRERKRPAEPPGLPPSLPNATTKPRGDRHPLARTPSNRSGADAERPGGADGPAARTRRGAPGCALNPTRSRRTPPDRAAAASRRQHVRHAVGTSRPSTTDARRRRWSPCHRSGRPRGRRRR